MNQTVIISPFTRLKLRAWFALAGILACGILALVVALLIVAYMTEFVLRFWQP
jgi:hypothetical protein